MPTSLRGLFARYRSRGIGLTRGSVSGPSPRHLREYWELAFAPRRCTVRILDAAQQAAQAVVRIKPPTGIGTGFVGRRLIMTCNHVVIGDRPTARGSTFTFNYQLDRHDRRGTVAIATARADGLFHANGLDYAVIEAASSSGWGRCPTVDAGAVAWRAARQHHSSGAVTSENRHAENFVAHADARCLLYDLDRAGIVGNTGVG